MKNGIITITEGGLGAPRRRKAKKACPYGTVKSGPRKGRCRKHPKRRRH